MAPTYAHQDKNKLNKVTGHAHVNITGLSPPAESKMGELYGKRESPTSEIGWAGEGTFAVFGGKVEKKGGTGNRGTEGGEREGGRRKEEGRKGEGREGGERGRREGERKGEGGGREGEGKEGGVGLEQRHTYHRYKSRNIRTCKWDT